MRRGRGRIRPVSLTDQALAEIFKSDEKKAQLTLGRELCRDYHDFSKFLALCTRTASWSASVTSKNVMADGLYKIIVRCCSDIKFRDKIMNFVDEATTSCEDRASYYFILMQLANLEPEKNIKDMWHDELYECARVKAVTQFITDQADKFIAHKKRNGVDIDEIEEYLAFMQIAPKLGININSTSMRYGNYSRAIANRTILRQTETIVRREMHQLTINHIATSGDFHLVPFLKEDIDKVEDKYAEMDPYAASRPANIARRAAELCDAVSIALDKRRILESESRATETRLARGAKRNEVESQEIKEQHKLLRQYASRREESELAKALAESTALEEARQSEIRRCREEEEFKSQIAIIEAREAEEEAHRRRIAQQERIKLAEETRIRRQEQKTQNFIKIHRDFKAIFKKSGKFLKIMKIDGNPYFEIDGNEIRIYNISNTLPLNVDILDITYQETPTACLSMKIKDDRVFVRGGVNILAEHFARSAEIIMTQRAEAKELADKAKAQEAIAREEAKAEEARARKEAKIKAKEEAKQIKSQKALAKKEEESRAKEAKRLLAEEKKLAKETKQAAKKTAKIKANQAKEAQKLAVKKAKAEAKRADEKHKARMKESKPFYEVAAIVSRIVYNHNPELREKGFNVIYDVDSRPNNRLFLTSKRSNPSYLPGTSSSKAIIDESRRSYDVYEITDLKRFKKKGLGELDKFLGDYIKEAAMLEKQEWKAQVEATRRMLEARAKRAESPAPAVYAAEARDASMSSHYRPYYHAPSSHTGYGVASAHRSKLYQIRDPYYSSDGVVGRGI